ncbi:MAG: CoA transferase [Alphaproteobacteria bacterium]|nr:CoA transferase [Alphaproteobacteria bacterium]
MSARANMPLAGVVVLDFGQVYQGPYATLLMATAGADVIKIEPPNGEPLRRRAPRGKSTTFPIAMLNSNKRAITLNLKAERGKQLLFRMAAKADVLLENFAPGVMDRLGVGFDVLHEINPRLVYASGTGYGLSGPDRDNLAMDLTIQAVSGLISVTGEADRPPLKSGPAVVDFLSGIHLYAATVTALYERSVTGVGRKVEVAMQEAAYPTLTSQLEAYWRSGQVPPRTGNASHNRVPINVYVAKDGYVAMNLAVEEHWHNLLAAMGREDIRDDPRFCTPDARVANRALVDGTIEAWTRTLPKLEIFAIAKQRRIPLAPVRDVGEVMRDAHMHERGFLEDIVHDEIGQITVPTSALRFHGSDRRPTTPSPKLGQHNEEVYCGWLGLSTAELIELKKESII